MEIVHLFSLVVLWRSKPGPFSVLLQQQVFSALELDIAPETEVLRRRPPKTLLEHPPKGTTFYVLLRRRKLTKFV